MLLIVAAVLPFLIMCGIMAWEDLREAAGEVTRTAIQERDVATAHATHLLDDTRQALRLTAAQLGSASGRVACPSLVPAGIDHRPMVIGWLGVVDAQGRWLCNGLSSSGTGAAGSSPPVADDAWFRSLSRSRDFTLGAMGNGSANERMMVAGIPIPDASGPGAFLVATLTLDRSLVLGLRDDGRTSLWLATPDGVTLPLGGADPAALPTADAVTRLLQRTGAFVAPSVAGPAYAYASGPVGAHHRIIVGYPAAADQRHARATLWRRVGTILVLAVASLLVIILGTDQMVVRPLRRLTAAVEGWRRDGRFEAPAGTAPQEMQDLARSFGDATATLTDRELQLNGAIMQQELLMQEIHHRVKNNLQIVASLLNLQASRIRQPEAKAEFQAARDRVRALATLHRHLYTHGEVHTINMRSFLTELCGQLFQAMGEQEGTRIGLHIEASELQMSSDQAVPLALIVTEAVSNSVKYAFPGGRTGHVSVSLTHADESATLVIQDDGVGIPAGPTETETGTRDGIGIQLIRGFARQLGARLTVHEDGGTRYEVVMPLRHERPDSQPA